MTFDNNALTFRKSMDTGAKHFTYCAALQFILQIILAIAQTQNIFI